MTQPDDQPFRQGTSRRPTTHFAGLFFDEFCLDSAWMRGSAWLQLPPLAEPHDFVLRGEYRPHPAVGGIERGCPGLVCALDGVPVGRLRPATPGPFTLTIRVPASQAATGGILTLRLRSVGFTNFLAWLGRITRLSWWQRFRRQHKNRQLRILTFATASGEAVFDFSNRTAPYTGTFARRHAKLGLNIAGFLTADLGIGESARCMVRAADAAGLATALVPLKLHCKNRLGDQTYADRLQAANPHAVNVVHLDPPASRDLDRCHGRDFRAGKYNIGYWAWELPEFPDAWVPMCAYFDEIWVPSEFAREAIALKAALPVLTMPHAISFVRPDPVKSRAYFGFPQDRFLFLVLYDLNSYSARKNPDAAIAAFRQSGLAARNASLVIKVHNVAGNETDLANLRKAVADLPGTVFLTDTLDRHAVYALEAACDCYVSLHRSEGFGLTVAETMYLGKPVISTDWSATAEFLNLGNGCPVRHTLQPLERNHGPYGKGQFWAEADVAHAAEWMRLLHAEPALAARLGAAARATIEERFSPGVIGERYRRRLESIATW